MTPKLNTRLFGGMLLVRVMLFIVRADTDISPEIPILSTTPGIRFRPAETKPSVMLEIFIDLNCPDSQQQWQVVKAVQAHYGTDKLDLVVQQCPLPYHRNSFLCTKGMYVIEDSSSSASLFAYIEESLAMWQNFSTASTVDMTETAVLEMLADMANRVTGINKTKFISNINMYEAATRAVWKYAVKRSVANTPSFFLNGVELETGSGAPSFNDWKTFVDPLINS